MIKYSIYVRCKNNYQLIFPAISYSEALDDLEFLRKRSKAEYKILLSEDEVVSFSDAKIIEMQIL